MNFSGLTCKQLKEQYCSRMTNGIFCACSELSLENQIESDETSRKDLGFQRPLPIPSPIGQMSHRIELVLLFSLFR